ncbi:MAG: hypothetical protein RLZZ352_1873 [Pseudomonadota bacterium]|jgi:type I restriction enzyme S subunit
MALKAGYKQTEVGVIPEEWVVKSLGKLASIERGKFSARPRNDPKFYGGNFPFIQTGDVTRANGWITKFTQTLNSDGLRVSRLFPKGTLFFTIAANIGDVGITRFEAACPDSLVAISANSPNEKGWLLFELSRRKADFENLASPGAQLNINLAKLRPYLLPVPTPPEQRAIATALSDVNALIESLEQLIAKKRLIKQGTMQELLTGKRRLPGFSGEWEVTRLGDFGSTFGGLTGKTKSDFGEGTSRYITFMNIMKNVVIDCDIFELVNISSVESQNRVNKGDLFFNGSSETPEEVGMCSVLAESVKDVYLNSFCFGFRFRESAKADGLYFAYYFRSLEGRDLLKSLAQGATRYNLSKTALLKVTFPVPLIEEQTAIATVLSDMDTELTALESQLEKTRSIKQGMMQSLLTGRIRLTA